jgi:DNA-binding CsgD family transcriptional regulator
VVVGVERRGRAEMGDDQARLRITSRRSLFPTTTTLTESERRVVELAVRAVQPGNVAALFMSVETVEANLTRIYRKLSVRSRRARKPPLPHRQQDGPIGTFSVRCPVELKSPEGPAARPVVRLVT